MANFANVKFLFKLTGQCETMKNDKNETLLKIWNYGDLFCYQGWDPLSIQWNARVRRTFPLPVSEFVRAVQFYNRNKLPMQNPYFPSMVVTLDHDHIAIVTAYKFYIGPYSDTNSRETLYVAVRENFEKINTHTNMKLSKSSNLISDEDKFKMAVKMDFMLDEFSYHDLNYNKYLSSNNIPFRKTDKIINPYCPDVSIMNHPFGRIKKNYQFLFQNKGKIEYTKKGINLYFKNPSNILRYEAWGKYVKSIILKRHFDTITVPEFKELFDHQERFATAIKAPVEQYSFQPTTLIDIETVDRSKKMQYVAVLKSVQKVSSSAGIFFDHNEDNEYMMEFSLDQVDVGFFGRKGKYYFNKKNEYLIRMDIDPISTNNPGGNLLNSLPTGSKLTPQDWLTELGEADEGFAKFSDSDYDWIYTIPMPSDIKMLEVPVSILKADGLIATDASPNANQLCYLSVIFNEAIQRVFNAARETLQDINKSAQDTYGSQVKSINTLRTDDLIPAFKAGNDFLRNAIGNKTNGYMVKKQQIADGTVKPTVLKDAAGNPLLTAAQIAALPGVECPNILDDGNGGGGGGTAPGGGGGAAECTEETGRVIDVGGGLKVKMSCSYRTDDEKKNAMWDAFKDIDPAHDDDWVCKLIIAYHKNVLNQQDYTMEEPVRKHYCPTDKDKSDDYWDGIKDTFLGGAAWAMAFAIMVQMGVLGGAWGLIKKRLLTTEWGRAAAAQIERAENAITGEGHGEVVDDIIERNTLRSEWEKMNETLNSENQAFKDFNEMNNKLEIAGDSAKANFMENAKFKPKQNGIGSDDDVFNATGDNDPAITEQALVDKPAAYPKELVDGKIPQDLLPVGDNMPYLKDFAPGGPFEGMTKIEYYTGKPASAFRLNDAAKIEELANAAEAQALAGGGAEIGLPTEGGLSIEARDHLFNVRCDAKAVKALNDNDVSITREQFTEIRVTAENNIAAAKEVNVAFSEKDIKVMRMAEYKSGFNSLESSTGGKLNVSEEALGEAFSQRLGSSFELQGEGSFINQQKSLLQEKGFMNQARSNIENPEAFTSAQNSEALEAFRGSNEELPGIGETKFTVFKRKLPTDHPMQKITESEFNGAMGKVTEVEQLSPAALQDAASESAATFGRNKFLVKNRFGKNGDLTYHQVNRNKVNVEKSMEGAFEQRMGDINSGELTSTQLEAASQETTAAFGRLQNRPGGSLGKFYANEGIPDAEFLNGPEEKIDAFETAQEGEAVDLGARDEAVFAVEELAAEAEVAEVAAGPKFFP